MSTFKEKMISGLKMVGKVPQKIASWSQKTQIIVAAGTAGTLMVASVGGVAIYQHNNSEEVVAEEDSQVQVVETETGETIVATEIIDVPAYISCAISSDSIEKDLTLYVKGSDNKKIEGEPFAIKLIDPDDADALADALAAIDDINDQLTILQEKEDGTYEEEESDSDEENASDESDDDSDESDEVIESTTGNGTLTLGSENDEESTESDETAGEDIIYLSSLTGEELTEKETLLLDKEKAIAAYAEALSALEGDVYTDSDSDGMIYIESIAFGDYVACLIPADQYDADSYAVDVNVKEKIEYQAVENIEDKTVSEEKAGDVEATHDDIVVEEVLQDTVEWVDSSVVIIPATFKETKAAALAASASGTNTATAEKKSEDSGNEEDETSTTESGSDKETESATTESESATTESATTEQTSSSKLQNSGLVVAGYIPGRVYLTEPTSDTSNGSGGGDAGQEQASKLSATANVVLYSDAAGANSTGIEVKAENVDGLSVTSSNATNLSVSESDGAYTLTATGATSDTTATVKVSGKDVNGETISVVCTVKIYGSSNQLKDASGHVLYMDNVGKTLAYYKDYSASKTYYYKTDEESKIYYGWQTIGSSRYYFDKDGNKVTGVQVIMGNKYTFGSDGALLTSGYGIDVSKWQGSIDWKQASAAVSFAIIRAGYRGSSGAIAVDSYAGTNIKNATANGVKVGLYVYSRAVNEVQAVEEASLAISIARQYGGISLPIYIDMEADNQKSLSTAQRDAIVKAFCATVKNAGYQAGVYANKTWLTNYLTPSSYTGYSIWCAQYNTSCTYGGRYDIWQYSSKGSIPGINGYVDLDQSYF